MDVIARRHRSRPWTIEDVRALFESRGCVLLEQQYTNYRQKMRYRCAVGHEYTQPFYHFVSGHGCPRCRNERRWSGRRINLDDVLLAVENEGLTEVAVRRDGQGTIRIAYTCAGGHRTETSRPHFLNGKRCRRCLFLTRWGAGNPRYNPSLTDEDRESKRKHEEYAAWRRAVFERDNYACQRCGRGGQLNAHHIVNYSSAPELRLVLANGLALCVGCHRGFHGTYGYVNNDADQLNRFIGDPIGAGHG